MDRGWQTKRCSYRQQVRQKGVLGAFGGHHGDIFISFITEGRPCRP